MQQANKVVFIFSLITKTDSHTSLGFMSKVLARGRLSNGTRRNPQRDFLSRDEIQLADEKSTSSEHSKAREIFIKKLSKDDINLKSYFLNWIRYSRAEISVWPWSGPDLEEFGSDQATQLGLDLK